MSGAPGHDNPSLKKLATGIGWLLSGRIVILFAGLGSMSILARLLSPAEFGAMATITVVVSLGTAIAQSGFCGPLIQAEQLSERAKCASFFLATLIGLLLALASVALSPLIESFFSIKDLSSPLIAASAALPISAAASIISAIMIREHRYRVVMTGLVLSNWVGYAIPAVALAWYGFGVWSLVIPTILAALVELVYLLCFGWRPRLLTLRHDNGAMLSNGAATIIGNLLNWAALSVPTLVVGRMFGVEALGLYSRASRLYSLAIQVFSEAFEKVFFSGLSSIGSHASKDAAFRRSAAILLPIYYVLSALMILHCEAIVLILLGPQWLTIVPVAQILFLALAGRSGYKITETFLLSRGLFKSAAVRQLIYLSLVIGGMLAGAPFGLPGVAWGFAGAIWIFYAVSLIWAARLAKLTSGEVGTLHLRACFIVSVLVSIDWLILDATEGAHWLLAHSVAGIVALTVAAIALLLAPEKVIGADLAWARSGMWSFAGRRLKRYVHREPEGSLGSG
jgi:PST family polysaccharide transporter